jgi:hypothetical protein
MKDISPGPVTIIGQDDFLIYGRTSDGTLVYTCVETDHHWLDAPHKGNCWDIKTGRNCLGETWFTCRLDYGYMRLWVATHTMDYEWHELGYDTDGSYLGWPESEDAIIAARSRKIYLPD